MTLIAADHQHSLVQASSTGDRWFERVGLMEHFNQVNPLAIVRLCTHGLHYRSDPALRAISHATRFLIVQANSTCLTLCVHVCRRLNSFREGCLRTQPWKGVQKEVTLHWYALDWQKFVCYVVLVKFRGSAIPATQFDLNSRQQTAFQQLLYAANAFVTDASSRQLQVESEEGMYF